MEVSSPVSTNRFVDPAAALLLNALRRVHKVVSGEDPNLVRSSFMGDLDSIVEEWEKVGREEIPPDITGRAKRDEELCKILCTSAERALQSLIESTVRSLSSEAEGEQLLQRDRLLADLWLNVRHFYRCRKQSYRLWYFRAVAEVEWFCLNEEKLPRAIHREWREARNKLGSSPKQ